MTQEELVDEIMALSEPLRRRIYDRAIELQEQGLEAATASQKAFLETVEQFPEGVRHPAV
jgi:hypothetical protein